MDIGQCVGRGDDNKKHDPPKDLNLSIIHIRCSSPIYIHDSTSFFSSNAPVCVKRL